jgi:hypothetical protein
VEENRPPAKESALACQVRELGFDPRQLTPRECEELVELYRRCPDEELTAVAR